MDNDKPIKIILLWESGVGKTSLINVSLGRNFIDDSITTNNVIILRVDLHTTIKLIYIIYGIQKAKSNIGL